MNKKILIIGPAWVGDMVMAQCLFKILKQHSPQVTIDVLAPAWSLPLLARMPEVSTPIIMPIGHGVLGLNTRYSLGKSLRSHHYDQAIVLPNSFKSALIPYFARIPERTGFRGEMRYGLLNDLRILNKTAYPLMIERFMALGFPKNTSLSKPYPLPSFQISADTQATTIKKYALDDLQKPILALCPGAEFGAAKRWPEAYYAEVANVKLAEGWQVWLFGSPKDNEAALKIMQLTHNQVLNFCGRTQLEEAIDLLALAQTVISNDSGLMHVAAALKKPLIALYGPTSPGFTPPLHDLARTLTLSIECQPCFQRICPLKHHRCMRELSPAKVLEAMAALSPHR